MYKILFIFLLISSFTTAQQSWKEQWQLPVEADCTWDVDQAGNVYLFHQQSIIKLDSTGRQLLTQSTKSIGTIAKIDASNWLKIAIFSEEQQQICYLDNALAIQPNCIDLTELGVNLAQQFSTSSQTDRIWVYDQLNSELQLITIRTSQRQIVQNLRSLVDLGNVLQMIEFQNKLYLLDNRSQLITFDNFGTFLGSIEIPSTHMQPFDKGILASQNNTISFYDTEESKPVSFFDMLQAETEIRQFCFTGKRLYVSTDSHLYCFLPE